MIKVHTLIVCDCREDNVQDTAVNSSKTKILKAALTFVPRHGWSKQSLALGLFDMFYYFMRIY